MTPYEAFRARLDACKAARLERARVELVAREAAEAKRQAEIDRKVAARPALDPARVSTVLVGEETGVALGVAVGLYGVQGASIPGRAIRGRLASGAVVDLTRTERARAVVDVCLRLATEQDDEATAMRLASTLLAMRDR